MKTFWSLLWLILYFFGVAYAERLHVVVGTELPYPPFQFIDDKGKITGFEIELLEEIGKLEDFSIEVRHSPRADLPKKLDDGDFQIIASAFSINPNRQKVMAMTVPFLDFERYVYFLDIPENQFINSIDDFDGQTIAVNGNSRAAVETALLLNHQEDKVIKQITFFFSLREVFARRSLGVVGDNRVIDYYRKNYPQYPLKILSTGQGMGEMGFGVKLGNKDLLDKLNRGLENVKKNGTYQRLLNKYFG